MMDNQDPVDPVGGGGSPGGGGTPGGGGSPAPPPSDPVVNPVIPWHPVTPPPPADGPRRRAVAKPTTPPPDPPPVNNPSPTENPIPSPAPTRRTVREPREIVVNQSAAGLERDIPLGRCLQGTKWLYANTFSNGSIFYGVAALGEGPIRSAQPRAGGTRLTRISGSATSPAGTKYQTSNAKVTVWVYDGSQTNFQETLSGLSAFDTTWETDGTDSPYDYLAFAVVRVDFDVNEQSTIPTFDFELEGYRDLYDPTDTTRKYSENRALWLREIITNTRWGRKWPEALINDTDWSTATTDCRAAIFPETPASAPTMADGGAGAITGTFKYKYTRVKNGVETLPSPISASSITVTAKKIDVTIPTGDSLTDEYRVYRSADTGDITTMRRVGTLSGNTGGTFSDNMSAATWASQARIPTRAPLDKYRYETGGILLSRKASGADWINTLRAECLGVLQWNDGKLSLFINKAYSGTPKVYRDTHDGATKPNVDPDSISWGRKQRSELPNSVEVRFTDIQNGYQTASVVKSRAGVTAGTELERRAVYELRGIGDSAYAGRIATQLLNLLWDDMEGTFKSDRSGLESLPWDVVELHGAGLVGQNVRVRKIRSEGEDFRFSFTEYQSASYSDTIVEEDAPLAVEEANSYDPSEVPPDVASATVAFDVNSGTAPAVLDGVTVYWPAPESSPGVEFTNVREYRLYKSGSLAMPPIPSAARPTVSVPLDITALTGFFASYEGGYSAVVDLVLKVVSTAGVESTGYAIIAIETAINGSAGTKADSHIPQGSPQAVQLSATAASNIGVALVNGPGPIAVTVASGTGATWHGALALVGANAPMINKTGGPLVFPFSSTTETTAANRFQGPNGETTGSLSIPANATFWMIYDDHASANRWRIYATQPDVQRKVTTADFVKTNNTLANITGLSADVFNPGVYEFRAELPTAPDATQGEQFKIGGTATATHIEWRYRTDDQTPPGSGGAGAILGWARNTSLATAATPTPGSSLAHTVITGTITVNAGGTLTIQYANQNAGAGTSTVRRGASLTVVRTNT